MAHLAGADRLIGSRRCLCADWQNWRRCQLLLPLRLGAGIMTKILAFLAVLLLGSPAFAQLTSYPATPGSGANFGAITDTSNYLHFMPTLCDGTHAAQCVTVLAGGAAVTSTVPSLQVSLDQKSYFGLPANAAQETGGNLANLYTTTGTTGGGACATDTGSCSVQARLQLLSQHLTTINGNLTGTLTVSPVSGPVSVLGTVNINQGTPGTTNGVGISYWGTHAITTDANGLPEFSNANFLSQDLSAWTAGSSQGNPIQGVYNSTQGQYSCVAGEVCHIQATQNRSLEVDWWGQGEGQMGTSQTPVQVSLANTATPTQPIVTIAQPQTGSTTNGNFGSSYSSTVTTTASHSYTQNTCVGGVNNVQVVNTNNESALLLGTKITSISGIAAPLNLYVFNANPTSSTCNNATGAFGVNSADVDKVLNGFPQAVTLSQPGTQLGNSPSWANINLSPPLAFQPAAGTKTLYYMLQVQPGGSFTESSSTSDLHVSFSVEQQ